jgi:hypothetical protein
LILKWVVKCCKFGLHDDFAIPKHVPKVVASTRKLSAEQMPTMTALWPHLTAHQRDTKLASSSLDSINATLDAHCTFTFRLPGAIVTCTKFVTEIEVTKPLVAQKLGYEVT